MKYIYKITNTINGKVYIGQHSNKNISNKILDPHYFCSSTNNQFWDDIRYYESIDILDNTELKYHCDYHYTEFSVFTNEIIQFCYSNVALDIMENLWIKYYRRTLGYDNVYNISSGARNTYEMRMLANTPEARKKKSESLKRYKKTPDHCRNISESKKGVPKSAETLEKLRATMSSEEVRSKISINTKIAMSRPEVKEKHRAAMSVALLGNKNASGNKGKPKSESHKEHMRKPKNKTVYLTKDGRYILISDNYAGWRKKGFIKVVFKVDPEYNKWYKYCEDNNIDPKILTDIYGNLLITD